jgi:hypothetical protein
MRGEVGSDWILFNPVTVSEDSQRERGGEGGRGGAEAREETYALLYSISA